MTRISLIALLALTLAIPSSAQALMLEFNLSWSNVDGGTADAMLTLDDQILLNPGTNEILPSGPGGMPNDPFASLMMTIGGTSAFAGSTFSKSDFPNIRLVLGSAVDLSSELVGQAGFSDFNVFGGVTFGVPQGSNTNRFAITGQIPNPPPQGPDTFEEVYLLTSFAPKPVPEPFALLQLMVAAGALAIGRARRAGLSKRRATPVDR